MKIGHVTRSRSPTKTNSMKPLEIPYLIISYQGVILGKIYFYSSIYEVGKHIFNSDLVWPMPSAGSLYKLMEVENLCSSPVCSCLATKSIPSLALESVSLGLQDVLHTSSLGD